MRSVNSQRRIAVVSLYALNNYGNCLQRHAVHELIRRAGFEAVSLDARIITRGYIKEEVYGFLAKLPFKAKEIERMRRFNSFNKSCEVVRVNIHEARSLSSEYFAFVVGSDQVWNPRIWNFNVEYNLLGFVDQGWKKIALAPSLGVSSLEESDCEAFCSYLADYVRLSVREDEGAAVLEKLLGRTVEVLPDPTIALGFDYWKAISSYRYCLDKPYVVVYELGEGSLCLAAARKFADCRSLMIVELNNVSLPSYAAGPADFVGLIFGAEAVFTDSFHASVFSLIGHTPFAVKARGGLTYAMSSRIATLGRMFDVSMDAIDQRFDWDHVDDVVALQAIKIQRYIESELHRIEGSRG